MQLDRGPVWFGDASCFVERPSSSDSSRPTYTAHRHIKHTDIYSTRTQDTPPARHGRCCELSTSTLELVNGLRTASGQPPTTQLHNHSLTTTASQSQPLTHAPTCPPRWQWPRPRERQPRPRAHPTMPPPSTTPTRLPPPSQSALSTPTRPPPPPPPPSHSAHTPPPPTRTVPVLHVPRATLAPARPSHSPRKPPMMPAASTATSRYAMAGTTS